MKIFMLILMLVQFSFSTQYTFLIEQYDKEIELEAKIVANIATSSIKQKVKLYIPKITLLERKVYSKYFVISENCKSSNFAFINKTIDEKKLCDDKNIIFFTNNYARLLSHKRYCGAFFWSKSRPNIVFIKKRLIKTNVILPKSYNQFIEDFDEK